MKSQQSRLGVFVSYDEKKGGEFQNAIDVCNAHEYVVWLERANIKTQRFSFPTTILIRITEKDRYYRGELRDIKCAEHIDRNALLAEASHRPATWPQVDEIGRADFKSVLYIAGLKQVPRPAGVARVPPPRRPVYLEEAILRGWTEPVVPLAEEVPSSAKLIEGAVCQVPVNAYERNPVARRDCIAHYRPTCVICGFTFGGVYGSLAEGFIHVHHIKPLSEIGKEYEVDPIADLRPVCPNCHAVIHLNGECRDIEEVRRLVDPRVLAFWTSFTKPGTAVGSASIDQTHGSRTHIAGRSPAA